jgi:hypothetical protein
MELNLQVVIEIGHVAPVRARKDKQRYINVQGHNA